MISAETKLHSVSFAIFVGLVVGFSGELVPLLSKLSPQIQPFAAVIASILSLFGYALISGFLLSTLGDNQWLVRVILGKQYIGGTYLGWIETSSGSLLLAIEQIHQNISKLRTNGESYKPDFSKGAQ